MRDSQKRRSRMAGAFYLAMLPWAIFALFTRFSAFIPADMGATLSNTQARAQWVTLGCLSWWAAQLLQIGLALTLFGLFKSYGNSAARLMLALIGMAVPISMVCELLPLAAVWVATHYAGVMEASSVAGPAAAVFLLWQLHEYGSILCHIFWGLWLLPLARLAWLSRAFPSWVTYLLGVAGLGYLVDFASYWLLPGTRFTVTQVTFIGEIIFAAWLLLAKFNGRTEVSAKTAVLV